MKFSSGVVMEDQLLMTSSVIRSGALICEAMCQNRRYAAREFEKNIYVEFKKKTFSTL